MELYDVENVSYKMTQAAQIIIIMQRNQITVSVDVAIKQDRFFESIVLSSTAFRAFGAFVIAVQWSTPTKALTEELQGNTLQE